MIRGFCLHAIPVPFPFPPSRLDCLIDCLIGAQASVFVYLGDQMRLIVAGQVPTATADRELFFQDVSLLLQALLGLAVGEEQVRH